MLKGLGDMAKLMKQAQEMQAKMAEAQERMTAIEAEGSAGAGMVATAGSRWPRWQSIATAAARTWSTPRSIMPASAAGSNRGSRCPANRRSRPGS